MDFERLLETVGTEPVFETGLLLAGDVDPNDVRRQLTRWTQNGRIYQLRRGVYALAPPHQKVKPHPFLVANRLVRGSTVSLQSALAHCGLIPEYVATVTSVTSGRPGDFSTPIGDYRFRHIKPALIFGYRRLDVGKEQTAYIAVPEKALLDLVHLQPGGDSVEYLKSLRLQNLSQLSPRALAEMAARAASPKLTRAATVIAELARSEAEEYAAV